jgi:hypothetical protein
MELHNDYPALITQSDARELRELIEEEYGELVTLREAFEFGEALLCWSIWGGQYLDPKRQAAIREVMERRDACTTPPPKPGSLSAQEIAALTFIRRSLNEGTSASVRQVCRAVGLRSSRSGCASSTH